MTLARLVTDQWRAILILVGLLCAGGLLAAFQIPIAMFPETSFPRIIIIVDDGVVAAPQVLVSVTRPIEEAMNGLPGIQRIRSKTERGAAEINLFFDWKVDVLQSLQLVQARLSQLKSSLPDSAAIRNVDRLTFAVFPVSGYSLTSPTREPASLREIATYTIRPRLARLPGVAGVNVAGGEVREYHVRIDPRRLAARAVTAQQVVEAIRQGNIIDSPGLIDENHQLELALVSGQARTTDDLKAIVVATVSGAPVTVADVAAVETGTAPNYTIVTADGRHAVLINVRRQPDASIVDVGDAVTAELASLHAQLPRDLTIAPFYDQSILVRESIRAVRDAIAIGLLLSVVILYAFLGSWGTTFVAILVIPVTVLATFLAMRWVGLSFDLMTLGGVAAAIGLVIDDAIVMVENIYSHMARGLLRLPSVQRAVNEIVVPIIGSTVTPVVVFLPLALLTGVTGVFCRSLALTMTVALLTSLVLALSFTPVLALRFVTVPESIVGHAPLRPHGSGDGKPPASAGGGAGRGPGAGAGSAGPPGGPALPGAALHPGEELGPILRPIVAVYEWVLSRALARPWIVAALGAGVLAASAAMFQNVGSDFLPEFDEGSFVMDYAAPPGASLAETDRLLRRVEAMLHETPEVESYSRRTGLEMGLATTEPNTGDFMVKLKAGHARSTDAVTDDLRKRIESSEPTLRVEFMGILTDLIGDLTSSPEPIEVKLFGESEEALHRTARQVKQVLTKIPGIVDAFDGIVISGPAVTLRIDPRRAGQLGVTAADVAQTVATAMTGEPASTILEGDRLITVRVRFPDDVRTSLSALRALPMRSAGTGALFRIDQVADLEYDPGQAEIRREGMRRTVGVTARLSGIDLGSAMATIKARLSRELKLPPGMTLEYGGIYDQQRASFMELALALGLAVVLVFLVLLLEFRSFVAPLAICAGAVLALAGVLAALLVTHTTLNIVSLMGMIMVVGIVAKNGILMLDAVGENRAAGESLRMALIHSGRRRFRPVLMTSLAAILGMLPLALAIGAGAQMLQPLAIAVIGGLAVALLLSLVVTPTVYSVLAR